jgi:hypothetical protein
MPFPLWTGVQAAFLVDKLIYLLSVDLKWCNCGADEEIHGANSGHIG